MMQWPSPPGASEDTPPARSGSTPSRPLSLTYTDIYHPIGRLTYTHVCLPIGGPTYTDIYLPIDGVGLKVWGKRESYVLTTYWSEST